MNILGITASQVSAGAWTPSGRAYVWYDASDVSTITHSAGAVSQWNDKGSAGFNLSQATGSRQPATNSVFQNGLNTISFDGGDVLTNTTKANWKFLHNGTKYVLGVVVKMKTTANTGEDLYVFTNQRRGEGGVIGGMLSQDNIAGRTSALIRVIRETSASCALILENNVWTATNVVCYTEVADPGNATAANRMKSYFGTGAAVGTNTATGTPSTADAAYDIGFGAADNILVAGITGYICEIVIMQSPYNTETDRTSLRDYLISKWGL